MSDKKRQKQITFFIVVSYFLLVLVYAWLRYIVFKGLDFVPHTNYIINKAFAGAAVLSVCTSYLLSSLSKTGFNFAVKNKSFKRFFGLSGFYFMCLHLFFGFRLINPELMPQFFQNDDLIGTQGQIIIILGALGFIIFLFPAVSSMNDIMKQLKGRRWLLAQRFGYGAFFVIMIHATMVGYQNWFNPHLWYGGMPPITLICVLLILLTLLVRLYVLIKYKK